MTAWQLLAKRGQTGVTDTIGGGGGQELGYAETEVLSSTTSVLYSSGAVVGPEIPGLTMSITTGENPFVVIVSGLFYNASAANGQLLALHEDVGTPQDSVIQSASPAYPLANVSVQCALIRRRKLAPGVHTYRVNCGVFNAGTAFQNGSPGGPIIMEAFEV